MNINHANNFAALKGKDPAEQKQLLVDAGWAEAEAGDYLRFLFGPREVGKQQPVTKAENSLEWAKKRVLELKEKAASNPEAQQKEILTWFERDIVHNRHLLGGSTKLDEASLFNPQLIRTQVVGFLEDAFQPSGRRIALLLGATGNGKTWGSLAWMNSQADIRVDNGKVIQSNAAYVTAYRISEMLTTNTKGRFTDALENLRRVRYLLIDELGGEPTGYKGSDFLAHFDYLISERHKFNRLVTLITTNASREQVKEAYGERFISRIYDVGMFLETTEADMRRERKDG